MRLSINPHFLSPEEITLAELQQDCQLKSSQIGSPVETVWPAILLLEILRLYSQKNEALVEISVPPSRTTVAFLCEEIKGTVQDKALLTEALKIVGSELSDQSVEALSELYTLLGLPRRVA